VIPSGICKPSEYSLRLSQIRWNQNCKRSTIGHMLRQWQRWGNSWRRHWATGNQVTSIKDNIAYSRSTLLGLTLGSHLSALFLLPILYKMPWPSRWRAKRSTAYRSVVAKGMFAGCLWGSRPWSSWLQYQFWCSYNCSQGRWRVRQSGRKQHTSRGRNTPCIHLTRVIYCQFQKASNRHRPLNR